MSHKPRYAVPKTLPPFLNGVWLDQHTTWLDEPWTHVAIIVICLLLVALLLHLGGLNQP